MFSGSTASKVAHCVSDTLVENAGLCWDVMTIEHPNGLFNKRANFCTWQLRALLKSKAEPPKTSSGLDQELAQ